MIAHLICLLYLFVSSVHVHVFVRFLRLGQFKRSLTFNSNPIGNDDEPRSHTGMGMGPGTGQRLSVDDIRQQQKDIIAGEIWLPWILFPWIPLSWIL